MVDKWYVTIHTRKNHMERKVFKPPIVVFYNLIIWDWKKSRKRRNNQGISSIDHQWTMLTKAQKINFAKYNATMLESNHAISTQVIDTSLIENRCNVFKRVALRSCQ